MAESKLMRATSPYEWNPKTTPEILEQFDGELLAQETEQNGKHTIYVRFPDEKTLIMAGTTLSCENGVQETSIADDFDVTTAPLNWETREIFPPMGGAGD